MCLTRFTVPYPKIPCKKNNAWGFFSIKLRNKFKCLKHKLLILRNSKPCLSTRHLTSCKFIKVLIINNLIKRSSHGFDDVLGIFQFFSKWIKIKIKWINKPDDNFFLFLVIYNLPRP